MVSTRLLSYAERLRKCELPTLKLCYVCYMMIDECMILAFYKVMHVAKY